MSCVRRGVSRSSMEPSPKAKYDDEKTVKLMTTSTMGYTLKCTSARLSRSLAKVTLAGLVLSQGHLSRSAPGKGQLSRLSTEPRSP